MLLVSEDKLRKLIVEFYLDVITDEKNIDYLINELIEECKKA